MHQVLKSHFTEVNLNIVDSRELYLYTETLERQEVLGSLVAAEGKRNSHIITPYKNHYIKEIQLTNL